MKINAIIIIVIICIISTFGSCNKDKCIQHDLGHMYFTSTDLQICPYKGNETLLFKDSLGNTMIYNGIGRSSIYDNRYYENHSPDPDVCEGDYFDTELNSVSFKESNNLDYISIPIWIDGGNPWHQNIKKHISWSVHIGGNDGWFFLQEGNFDNFKILKYDTTQCIITFKDSLKLGPKKYYSVYILKQLLDPYGLQNLQFVFYTIKDGIVGFRTKKNGISWYIDN